MASGMPAWFGRGAHAGWSGHAPTAAEIAQFQAKGGAKGNWTADLAHNGKHGSFTPPAMSATLKADFTTLQNDEKQLRSELPASVTSAVAADRAVISKAFASLAPSAHNGTFMVPQSTSSTPPSGGMTAMLEKAGISAAQATQIAADFQTYQADLKTTDPTLQAKIAADQAAIVQAGGPTMPTGARGMGLFGGPMHGMPSA